MYVLDSLLVFVYFLSTMHVHVCIHFTYETEYERCVHNNNKLTFMHSSTIHIMCLHVSLHDHDNDSKVSLEDFNQSIENE